MLDKEDPPDLYKIETATKPDTWYSNEWLTNIVLKNDQARQKSLRHIVLNRALILVLAKIESIAAVALSDCKEILDEYPEAESGFYEIELWQSRKILIVNCDMDTDGGGWTIFHRRFDGSVKFYRNFTEYENGFGNTGGELWLGLKYIQELADQSHSEVRVDIENYNNDTAYETFQEFKLIDGRNYKLNIGLRDLSTDKLGGLAHNNLLPFTTYDRDLDTAWSRNCAVDRHGGWWYGSCTSINLNGLYVSPDSPDTP
ncbi:ficolin-1-like, partial [Ruditapes philippinarum]|uniref:ficolin-1-like n=1 Tax=Ruditapes philippinarum TaxID=129788 RepID=UPI00295B04F7